MTQPTQVLRQARDLVAGGWCQGISARREDGSNGQCDRQKRLCFLYYGCLDGRHVATVMIRGAICMTATASCVAL